MATSSTNANQTTINGKVHPNDSLPWASRACSDVAIDHEAALKVKTQLGKTGAGAAQAVLTKSGNLWPNGATLEYGFMSSYPGNEIQQQKVAQVITIWEQYANIKFKLVNAHAADIRITFDPSLGSWCYVGQEIKSVPRDKATMNLGWVNSTDRQISQTDRGVILHEFGHALGLMHEHQSPARGGTITLKEDAVLQYYEQTQNWTEDQVRRQIIDVYNAEDVSNYSQLDLHSIMMYFMPADMDVQHIDVDPNYDLSDLDKAYILINYPPIGSSAKDPAFTMESALKTAGVDDDTKAQIMAHYQAGEWEDVRYHFTNWASAARAKTNTVSPGHEALPPSNGPKPDEPAHDVNQINLNFCSSETAPYLPPGSLLDIISRSSMSIWNVGSTILYRFLDSRDKTSDGVKAVRDAFNTYQNIANIRFAEAGDKDKPMITIAFIPPTGTSLGSSAVSRIGSTAVNYSLPMSKSDSFSGATLVLPNLASASEMKRTIYHEVGHVLGLQHCGSNTVVANTNYVPSLYDADSIMLYPDNAIVRNAWPAQQDRFNPQKTNFVSGLSEKDKAFLQILYPFLSSNQDKANFTKALQTLKTSNSPLDKNIDVLWDRAQAAMKSEPRFSTDEVEDLRIGAILALAGKPVIVPSDPPPEGPSSGIEVPDQPQNDLPNAPASQPPKATASTGSFINILIQKLNEIFSPAGNQIFTLQFPGRFLSIDQYAWDTTTAGIYGQFIKPTVVNESEFRLVDALYDVGTVVSAPNGINLSIVYEQCLNNLIPAYQSSPFTKQQDAIRKWLMKEVKAAPWIQELIRKQHENNAATSTPAPSSSAKPFPASAANPGAMFSISDKLTDTNTVNRMEMSEILMTEYLSAKAAWEMERDAMMAKAKGDQLEDVTRTLAHLTPIREAQLASKYADAVVRGYSHTIRQYLGYMDVKSSAEFLQDAKDSLRESSTSSLDGSMRVYPVQLQPIDWFVGCSTSFTMEDLTQDPDLMQQQINAKSQKLDVLQQRLAAIQFNDKPDMKDIQAKLDAAEAQYDTAQANLAKQYNNNVISLAQSFLDQAGGGFAFSEFQAAASKLKISPELFTGIENGMKALSDAQMAVTTASRSYSRLMAQKALAEATDTEKEKASIELEVASLTKELSELTARCAALRSKQASGATPSPPSNLADVPIIPTVSGTSGGSRWQEIVMRHEVKSSYSSESSSSNAKTSQTNVNLFLGSYHRSASEGDASASNKNVEMTNVVEVGFRATLVTVDRGGWFQPQFLKSSSGFYHLNDKVTWSKWPEGTANVQDLKNQGDPAYQELNKGLLPAYPVGYIICKDVTIKIEMSAGDVASEASNMESTLASSGGVLCFSTSSSESHTASSKSYSSTMTSDGMIIRIPGPQILGYILELTDNDESQAVPETIPDDFLIPDSDYDAALSGPSHDITAPAQDSAKPPANEVKAPSTSSA